MVSNTLHSITALTHKALYLNLEVHLNEYPFYGRFKEDHDMIQHKSRLDTTKLWTMNPVVVQSTFPLSEQDILC